MSPDRSHFFYLNAWRMSTLPIVEKIKTLAEQSVQGRSVYLLDVEIKGGVGHPILWIYIDAIEGQATIEDCAAISRELRSLIEAHELFPEGEFTLNVSTPGLSRPLSDLRQYHNNILRKAKIKYKTDQEHTQTMEGTLKQVDEAGIVLETKTGDKSLRFADIIETKIIPAL